MAELTISIENENFIQVPVELEHSVEQLKRVIEFETTVPINQQVLTFDGKILENSKKLSEYSIKNGDMLLMTKNIFSQRQPQPQQQQQQQQQQPQPQQGQPYPQQLSQQQQQNHGFTKQPNEIFSSADSIIDYFSKNPEDLNQIIENNPQLAEAILARDKKALENVCEQYKYQRRMQELAIKDPFGEEYQKLLYEQIQRQNIEENMAHAMEHTPEVFASVYMLYIKCSINNYPIKAFVDTGAQQSIMSEKCAEKCGLARIIDKRFQGIAKGVGTSKIIGRVHNTNLKLGNSLFSVSLSILENQDVDFILGLDMLKRHQVILDLGKGIFQIGDERLEFLHEKDLKDILGDEDKEQEDLKKATDSSLNSIANVNKPSTTASNTTTTTTTQSPISSANPTPTATTTTQSPTTAINRPTQPITGTGATNTFNQMPEESIQILMGLGCSRDKAIKLLTQTRGNVDAAASLFFG